MNDWFNKLHQEVADLRKSSPFPPLTDLSEVQE
jgi:hypothetical protein